MGGLDLKWIIIFAFFCILMVALGRNPVEERMEARRQSMEGKDKLIESIKEHNSGKKKSLTSAFQFRKKDDSNKDAEDGTYGGSLTSARPKMNTPAPPAKFDIPQADQQGYYPPPPQPPTTENR